MRKIDVCNGDADGLCAVLQWRLSQPATAELVTGVKRDIALLDRVFADAGDHVLVCDISMQRNRASLIRLLNAGVRIWYFDHHVAHDIPKHPALRAHVDATNNACTSMLVDRYLGGRFRSWAAVGAYGDGFHTAADALVQSLGLDASHGARLRALGEAINYNAYGDDEGDVCINPAQLYKVLARYSSPFAFLGHETIAAQIQEQRASDLANARRVAAYREDARGQIFFLPDASWSRRAIGAFANELALADPLRAHAVLRRTREGHLLVSVRAPLRTPAGAAQLCSYFGGDGRAGAAGIDELRSSELERFLTAFESMQWG